jgi:hypothetical protein
VKYGVRDRGVDAYIAELTDALNAGQVQRVGTCGA